MQSKTRTVISKSAKRKMSTPTNVKANNYTEMVVYKEKVNGKTVSKTKHEVRSNNN